MMATLSCKSSREQAREPTHKRPARQQPSPPASAQAIRDEEEVERCVPAPGDDDDLLPW